MGKMYCQAGMPTASPVTHKRCVVLAWEQGGNWGHLSRLHWIAHALQEQGVDVVLAVSANQQSAFSQFTDTHNLQEIKPEGKPTEQKNPKNAWADAWRLVFMPALPAQKGVNRGMQSYVDILLKMGFNNAHALANVTKSWVQLFEHIKPHAVVLDCAPCAQLAAMLLNVRAFQISSGFDAPPAHCPVFDFGLRGVYVERQNQAHKHQLASSLAEVIQRMATALPKAHEQALNWHTIYPYDPQNLSEQDVTRLLKQFLEYPVTYFDVIPELDPYAHLRAATCEATYKTGDDACRYLGPLNEQMLHAASVHGATTQNSNATGYHTEKKEHGQKADVQLFAYVRLALMGESCLQALAELIGIYPEQLHIVCVCPDATDAQIKAFTHLHLTLTREPVDLHEVLPHCHAVFHYGAISMNHYALGA